MSMLEGECQSKIDMNMIAGFTDFVNIYSLWGGLTVTLLCLLTWPRILCWSKTVGDIRQRAAALAKKVVLAVFSGILGHLWHYPGVYDRHF